MTSDSPSRVVGLDVGLVEDWILSLEIGATPPFTLNRLGEGKSNLTYLLRDRIGAAWVLRRPPLGDLLPSAHDVAREHRILSALAPTPVPTPKPFALRAADDRLDAPLLLMEHVDGLAIDNEAALDPLEEELRHAIGLSLGRALASVHAVGIEAAGLTDIASHTPYAARQLRRWRRQFEDSRTQHLPLVAELADRLEARMPAEAELTLVHGDYHLLNAIVDPVDGSVRAILDWELSTLGDPLGDLGCLLAYWPQADDPVPPAPSALPAQPGFPTRAEIAAAYAEASGRDLSPLGFWEALGCWKVAVICQGVLRRRLADPSNGNPAEAAERAGVTLERAAWVAERNGL